MLGCATPTHQALGARCNTGTGGKLTAAKGKTQRKEAQLLGPAAQVTDPVYSYLLTTC